MGFSVEFTYPSQVTRLIIFGLEEQLCPQKGRMTYIRKKGSQQTINVVTITAMVRAAFRSFDNDILAFSLMNLCMSVSTGVIASWVLYWVLLSGVMYWTLLSGVPM